MLSLQATALKGKFRLQHKDFLHFVDNFPFFNYVSCYVHGSSLGLLLDTAVTMLGIQREGDPIPMSTEGAGYKLNWLTFSQ